MATATKTRKRSPFQALRDDEPASILTLRNASTPPTEDGYLDTRYVEYVNAERTVAVVSTYGSYGIALKTTLEISDVVAEDSPYLTEVDYAGLRERGVWFLLKDSGDKSKTRTRGWAETLLEGVQDIQEPLKVTLDGSYAPALTIASQRWLERNEYYQDAERIRALRPIAESAGVDVKLLALAVKEDRLIWSTPPVAPAQVMVVVCSDETGVLSERLVDEIVLATKQVEGLGSIVHQGSVPEFLLVRRERQQRFAVTEILEARDALVKALDEVEQRTASLRESLDKGQIVGRGFHDTVRLADVSERAQAASDRYAAAVRDADLPEAFALSLRTDVFKDNSRYSIGRSDTRAALEALAALNGMNIDRY